MLWFRTMRPRRLTPILSLVLAAALLAAVAACKKQPPARPPGPTKGPAVPLKPVTIEPAPTCEAAAAPASRPRGTLIALYHTANVVGEVEPCG